MLAKERAQDEWDKAQKELKKALLSVKAFNAEADLKLDPALAELAASKWTPVIVVATHLTALAVGLTLGIYLF